ncbi:hypothetical protein [Roseibacillus ishigakijimensis]|uniref:Uncharacterized protein n=1 Tax=Roseibacillus ishigakijimensis TaxID=454146 RepID=A0A934RR30_9BACT|nr:hypothetical protein [Roseibacillus ishigakijimensis]MBK1835358.1 hypothetical protein [Roseibacillus ishigakijimensis]
MLRFLGTQSQPNGTRFLNFAEDKRGVYYLFRPLSYADEFFTGMGSHLEPHQ